MPQHFNQANIYNKRYKSGYYGTSSPVPVLTSERNALISAFNRRRKHIEKSNITLLDFGYGTGRVPNDVLMSWGGPEDLTVVAYDVAAEGLKRSMQLLLATGEFIDKNTATRGCLGTLEYRRPGPGRRIIFVAPAKGNGVEEVLLDVNNGAPYDVVTAWYDVVSHMQSAAERLGIFSLLGRLAHTEGELIITASTIGDFNADYGTETFRDVNKPTWGRDVIYETETGDENFIHLYGEDFWQDLQATLSSDNQKLWLEPIRLLGPEYDTVAEERAAYELLYNAREALTGRHWSKETYSSVHTVGGFRSGSMG